MRTQPVTSTAEADRDRPGPGTTEGSATRTTARTVGGLFIIGTIAGALSAVVLTPLLDAPDTLRAVGDDPGRALLAAALVLTMGFALALIPLVAYPVLRATSEPLALGYVVFRSGLETVTYLGSALVWVVLVSLGRDRLAADGSADAVLDVAGSTLLEVNAAVGDVALTLVFSLGALMFYSVLFRARLVPRWLSGWGLVAALIWLVTGGLTMAGVVQPRSTAQIVPALPIAIHEIVLAGWLITKGFSEPRDDRSVSRPVPELQLS